MSATPCPPWCTQTHRPGRPARFHEGVVAGFGRHESESQICLDQFTREGLPEQPTLELWAIALDSPRRGESASISLSAGDARVLADVLAKVPPDELASFVEGLRRAAALVDPA